MTDKEKIEELQLRVQALENFIRGTFPAFKQLQIPFEYKPLTIKKEPPKRQKREVGKMIGVIILILVDNMFAKGRKSKNNPRKRRSAQTSIMFEERALNKFNWADVKEVTLKKMLKIINEE